MPINPFVGIKEANQQDLRPQTLKESNQLYGKYWKQGFFAMVGERHPATTDEDKPFLLKLTDPTLNILYQAIFGIDDSDNEGHPGLPDLLNPLVWASFFAAALTVGFLKSAAGDNETFTRAISGIIGALLLIPTVPLVLAHILTTYFLDIAKVITAVVTVTVTSAVWYPAKLATLQAREDGYTRFNDGPSDLLGANAHGVK